MPKVKLFIIGGKLKSQSILITKNTNLRPILTRVRRTIFDILENLIDFSTSNLLDLCTGSGILSLEFLSRGGSYSVPVDIDPIVCKELRENINKFNLSSKTKIINKNILLIRANKGEMFNLIFLDLPYKSSFLVKKILKKLYNNKWIHNDNLLVITIDQKEKIVIDNLIEIKKEKIISNSKIIFAKYIGV